MRTTMLRLGALALLSTAATAQTDAATALTARIEQLSTRQQAGRLLRLDNAAEAPLLRAAFDRTAIRRVSADLGTVADVCDAMNGAGLPYAQAYLASGGSSAPDGHGAETVLFFAAADLCTKTMLRAAMPIAAVLAPASADDRARLEAFASARPRIVDLATGLLIMVGSNLPTPDKLLLGEAIAEDAATAAASLTAVQRAGILGRINGLLATVPPAVAAALRPAQTAYAASTCNAICALPE